MIRIWCELQCSSCDKFGYGEWVGGKIPKRKFLEIVKASKWSVNKSTVYCPECVEKMSDVDKMLEQQFKEIEAAEKNAKFNGTGGNGYQPQATSVQVHRIYNNTLPPGKE